MATVDEKTPAAKAAVVWPEGNELFIELPSGPLNDKLSRASRGKS